MNGLEALEKLCQLACDDRDSLYYLQHKNCKEVEENIEFKPYCNGCPYCGGKLKKTIEKELEAFEIVDKKGLSTNELWFIKNDKSFEEYTETLKELYYGDETLDKRLKTEDEFDLLKEVMK